MAIVNYFVNVTPIRETSVFHSILSTFYDQASVVSTENTGDQREREAAFSIEKLSPRALPLHSFEEENLGQLRLLCSFLFSSLEMTLVGWVSVVGTGNWYFSWDLTTENRNLSNQLILSHNNMHALIRNRLSSFYMHIWVVLICICVNVHTSLCDLYYAVFVLPISISPFALILSQYAISRTEDETHSVWGHGQKWHNIFTERPHLWINSRKSLTLCIFS